VLFIEPSEWGFLPLCMGAGQAAAGRPLGATVEVRLQRHGASG
jgi:hypothetical protein